MKKISLTVLLLFTCVLLSAQLKPNAQGLKLKQMYLNMHIEKAWINGQHVNWRTGLLDDPNATTENATHCSAFMAAACDRMGIYILRPPEHAQELLANAQYDWLHSDQAEKLGWHKIFDNVLVKAQNAANCGYMVIATFKNPNPQRAGHIVCVIPAVISLDSIAVSGPRVTQSSRVNSSNLAFRKAFHRVLKSWPRVNVAFFYNDKCIK